jgi:hypothetical protein
VITDLRTSTCLRTSRSVWGLSLRTPREAGAWLEAVKRDIRATPQGPIGPRAEVETRSGVAVREALRIILSWNSNTRLAPLAQAALYDVEMAVYGYPPGRGSRRDSWGQHLSREARDRAESYYRAMWVNGGAAIAAE